MRSILAGLRKLVVPWGQSTGPRVVIQTDDPIMAYLNQAAAVMWYFNDNQAFMLSVEQSGSPDRGQLHLWTVDATTGIISQWIDIDHDVVGTVRQMIFGQNNVQDISFDMAGDFFVGGARAILASSDIHLLSLSTVDPVGEDVKFGTVSIPRGIRGLDSAVVSSAAIGAEAIVHTITNMVWKAGRAYELIVGGRLQGSVANSGRWQIRRTNIAGAITCVIGETACPVAGTIYNLNARQVVRRTAGTNLTETVVLTVAASAGTVTHAGFPVAPRYFEIRDIGAASDYPNAPAI